MYKVNNNISPDFICEIFPKSNAAYNLRNKQDFKIPAVNTVFWGSETLRNMGHKVWNLLPVCIKQSHNFGKFKSNIKHWKPENSPCTLCLPYIPEIGFL